MTKVGYEISLKDLLSQTLGRAQKNVGNFDNEVERAIADINRLNAAMGQTGGMAQSFMQTTGAVALGSILTRGVEMAGRAAVSQVKDILSAGLDASKLRAEFSTLTGGKEMGNALFGDLTKYIQDSIFGTELYTSAKTLLSYGDSAKQILPDLKMLGDIAMGDKEKMNSLVVAFGQVMSTGKLMGQDLNQMIQGAGFNPLMVIAENTRGKQSVEQRYQQLKKMGEAGEISFAMIREAFESATGAGGRFYKMLDNIGETPFGKMQAMQGNIDAAKQQLGEALLPAMSDFMDAAKPLINELPAMFEALKPTLKSAISGFTDLATWLSKNGDAVASIAKGVKLLAEAYVIWKAATGATTAVNWLYNKSIQATIFLRGEETVAVNALTAATERLAIANASVGATSAIPVAAVGASGVAASGVGAAAFGMAPVVAGLSAIYFLLSDISIGLDVWRRSDEDVKKINDKSSVITNGVVMATTVADNSIRTSLPVENKWGKFTPKNQNKTNAAKSTADPLKQDIAKVTGQQVKNTYITINGGLIHDFTIKTTTLKESTPQIKRVVTGVITDAINDSQITD